MQWVYLKGYKTGWILFEQGGAGLCAGGMYQERDCASGWWEPPRGPERPPRAGGPELASGWWEPPRGPERPPRAGGPEPPFTILLARTPLIILLGVAVTRSGWPRTSMGGCSSYQEHDCARTPLIILLGVAVTRSGWPRTSMGGCSSYQERVAQN